MKTALIILGLAVVACLLFLGVRSDEGVTTSTAGTARAATGSLSFEVQVVKPRSGRPLFGILPKRLEARLLGEGDLSFDNASPGAKASSVEHNRLELSADGWDLFIEANPEGRITPGTQLVFQLMLANKQRRLLCHPADKPDGYLRTSTQPSSDRLHGHFLVELATCENTETGRIINWPPAPLTVRGSFEGLPPGGR